jgi:hypothetical protein
VSNLLRSLFWSSVARCWPKRRKKKPKLNKMFIINECRKSTNINLCKFYATSICFNWSSIWKFRNLLKNQPKIIMAKFFFMFIFGDQFLFCGKFFLKLIYLNWVLRFSGWVLMFSVSLLSFIYFFRKKMSNVNENKNSIRYWKSN